MLLLMEIRTVFSPSEEPESRQIFPVIEELYIRTNVSRSRLLGVPDGASKAGAQCEVKR